MFPMPLAISAAILSLLTKYALAEATTNATCIDNLWSTNQYNQSSCLVAAGLEASCFGGSFNIPALLPTQRYSGPRMEASNRCTCSTVVYSLVSACASCQGNNFVSWDQWRTNCSDDEVSLAQWPLPIPAGTAIPAWAYLNVTATGLFDINGASQLAAQHSPDSTSSSSPTHSSQSDSKTSSHAGAIAGGVVGGVVGLALVLLGAFLVYKKRNARAASDKFMPGGEKYDITGADRISPTLASPTWPMQNAPPKLYDPSDPSTFPVSPAPTYPTYPSRSPFEGSNASDSLNMTAGPTSPQPLLSSIHTHQTSPSLQSGRYAGVPEV